MFVWLGIRPFLLCIILLPANRKACRMESFLEGMRSSIRNASTSSSSRYNAETLHTYTHIHRWCLTKQQHKPAAVAAASAALTVRFSVSISLFSLLLLNFFLTPPSLSLLNARHTASLSLSFSFASPYDRTKHKLPASASSCSLLPHTILPSFFFLNRLPQLFLSLAALPLLVFVVVVGLSSVENCCARSQC